MLHENLFSCVDKSLSAPNASVVYYQNATDVWRHRVVVLTEWTMNRRFGWIPSIL